MSLAVANYHDAHGCFPPPYLADENGVPMHSWRVLLLPFLDGQSIYKKYRFDEPWNGPNNSKLQSEMPQSLRFTFRREEKTTDTNYLAVVGPNTMWPESGRVTYNDVVDGTGETIHFVECRDSGIHWMEPRDLHLKSMTLTIDTDSKNGISSWHEPPAVAMADGSVMKLETTLSQKSVRSMLLINDNTGIADSVEEIDDGRNRPLKDEVDPESKTTK